MLKICLYMSTLMLKINSSKPMVSQAYTVVSSAAMCESFALSSREVKFLEQSHHFMQQFQKCTLIENIEYLNVQGLKNDLATPAPCLQNSQKCVFLSNKEKLVSKFYTIYNAMLFLLYIAKIRKLTYSGFKCR